MAIAQRKITFRHLDGTPGRQGNAINVANPDEKIYSSHRYLFEFGSIGVTYVLVYGDSLGKALEDAAGWLADNKLWGHITPHTAPTEDLCCDCADPFECDSHTYTESGWLTSHEWGVIENPSNQELRRIHSWGC